MARREASRFAGVAIEVVELEDARLKALDCFQGADAERTQAVALCSAELTRQDIEHRILVPERGRRFRPEFQGAQYFPGDIGAARRLEAATGATFGAANQERRFEHLLVERRRVDGAQVFAERLTVIAEYDDRIPFGRRCLGELAHANEGASKLAFVALASGLSRAFVPVVTTAGRA